MSPVRDTVLRLALISMALDPGSGLTPDQLSWCNQRLQRHTPFSKEERIRLREPLLTWAATRMPTCTAILEAQFADEEPVRESRQKILDTYMHQ